MEGSEFISHECRVRKMPGIGGFGECLSANSQACPHSLSFGWKYYCRHPDWEKIEAGQKQVMELSR